MAYLLTYTEQEYATVLMHIEEHFGEILQIYTGSAVDHIAEQMDRELALELCLIAPTPQRNYYMVVTIGLGAISMPTPTEFRNKKLDRAELCFALPVDTDIANTPLEEFWPTRAMNLIAFYVLQNKSWIAWGHTFFDGTRAFSLETNLSSIMLVSPSSDDSQFCTLPNGEDVNFYCLLPIYKEELKYVEKYDAGQLLERLSKDENITQNFKEMPVIDNNRPNVCAVYDDDSTNVELVNGLYFIGDVVDYNGWHYENIEENHLPVDRIMTLNHLAIFLRYAIENNLISDEFIDNYSHIVEAVYMNDINVDLREFLATEFEGFLLYDMFNERGVSFATYYYNNLADVASDELHSYTADIDSYAQRFFKDCWAYDLKYKPYAYLFLPYTEKYYRDMKGYLDKHFANWEAMYGRHLSPLMS